MWVLQTKTFLMLRLNLQLIMRHRNGLEMYIAITCHKIESFRTATDMNPVFKLFFKSPLSETEQTAKAKLLSVP